MQLLTLYVMIQVYIIHRVLKIGLLWESADFSRQKYPYGIEVKV